MYVVEYGVGGEGGGRWDIVTQRMSAAQEIS